MTHPADPANLSNPQLLQINRICNDYEAAWKSGEPPSLIEFIQRSDDELHDVLRHYLIELDIECRSQRQQHFDVAHYLQQFPEVDSSWLRQLCDEACAQQSAASDNGPVAGVRHGSKSGPAQAATADESRDAVTVDVDDSNIDLTVAELLERVQSSKVVTADFTQTLDAFDLSTASVDEIGTALVNAEFLTDFQLDTLVQRPVEPLVLGDYVLQEKIGEGGMGAEYRAVHRRMKRDVAVKVLKSNGEHAEEMARRFAREIQVAARLSHPNIVAAYDAGEAHGLKYLVSEYIDGQNLAEIVREHGPLSLPDAVDVMAQAVEGLACAHKEGIVHRDIKPSNLLLDDEGNAKLLDVGLARINTPEDTDNGTDLTQTGLIMGTVDFMSPEQARNTRLADERSDIYSMGCTLHFLLTARPPYYGTTSIEKLLAHRDLPIPDLLDLNECVPGALQDLLEGCMAKTPGNRYQNADELRDAIHALRQSPLPEIRLPVVTREELQQSRSQAWTAPAEETGKWSRRDAQAALSPAEDDTLVLPAAARRTSATSQVAATGTQSHSQPASRRSSAWRWIMAGGVAGVISLGLWASGMLTATQPAPTIRNLAELSEREAVAYLEDWSNHVADPDLSPLRLDVALIPPGSYTTSSGMMSLDQPLFMSTTEVPVGVYRRFVVATGHRSDAGEGGYGFDAGSGRWVYGPNFGWNNLGDLLITDDMPTVCVNYNDATAFCQWASEQTGLTVRLPTEQEWEYASRCGREGDWSCGASPEKLGEYAWYAANSQSRLFKVGTLAANAWGLFDMHGNECEWCLPGATDPDHSAPLKGGSYSSLPEECTHSWRQLQRKRQVVHGSFRVVVEVPTAATGN